MMGMSGKHHPHPSDPRRGAMLATTLMLMLFCSIGALWVAKTVLDQQVQNTRRRELARALFAAEAGVQLVLHWGNAPTDYTPNPTLFAQGTHSPTYPALRTQLTSSGLDLNESALAALAVGSFTSDYHYNVGQLTRLQLLGHTASDPVDCMFKIISTARSAGGIQHSVTAYITENTALNPLTLSLKAALISFGDINFSGVGKIHWGEAWAKGSIIGADDSTVNPTDGWINYRAEGQVNSGATDPRFYSNVAPGTLNWPTFDYQTFKKIAMTHNNYFYPKNGGWYTPGPNGTDVAANPFTRNSELNEIIFLDTLDRQPPRADGGNLFDQHFTGNRSNTMIGIYWFGGNVTFAGQGSPPGVAGTMPDGTPQALTTISLNGVIYAAGTITILGNANIYGSAVAQRGFTAFTGSADCYYNSNLMNGIPLETGVTGSRLTIALQKNR